MTLRRVLLYGLGIALGVMLALPNARDAVVPVGATVGRDAPGESRPTVAPTRERARSDQEAAAEGNRVYAASGVTLESLRSEDVFVGYAVVRSHDARLDVGDVITAVNGQMVEDSAAGGELLIAALRNPEAELTLQSRADWSTP